MGEMRSAYKILVGKCEGKIPLGRPRRRWEDNIRMNFRVIALVGVNGMHLTQGRDLSRATVNTVMNFRVP
jgi:hypothetical protein